jgi:ankyrin repeat protein
LLTTAKEGWVTVYDETSEAQKQAELQRVAQGLSVGLAADVFAFLLHDSDLFIYWAYRKGKLLDQFNSNPDYFGKVDSGEKKKWAGNFEKLLPLAPAGVTVAKVRQILKKKAVFHEEIVAAFARLMGIDPERAGTGFRYLIRGGHDFQLVYGRSHSPNAAALIESADKGDVNSVRKLLSGGVSPNLKSRLGESLLATALRFHRSEIALALLDAGADPFRPPETNAVWAAAAHGEREVLARLLQSPSPELQACLRAALNAAVQGGHVEIVGDLLKAGADPNAAGESGFTALMSACCRGPEVIWEILAGREFPSRPEQKRTDWTAIVRRLLEAGADINARARNGMTALMLARSVGQRETVDILEKAGADPDLKPSGPELNELAGRFRMAVKSGGAPPAPGGPGKAAAAGAGSKAHLNPQVRDALLKLMKCRRDK